MSPSDNTVTEEDNEETAPTSNTALEDCVAEEDSELVPSFVSWPAAETVAALLNADTPFIVITGAAATVPDADVEVLATITITDVADCVTVADAVDAATIVRRPEPDTDPVSANKLAAAIFSTPTLRVVPAADILEAAFISSEGALESIDTNADALRVAVPACVTGPTAAGRVERGSSLIAPKPNMAYPLINKQ
tara:strand:+ start:342 stop:923 length:582 start_codon:yes stop_codon:yes gene_type:complete